MSHDVQETSDPPGRPEKQILVAGVGNAWMRDDAFGGEVARRMEAQGVPSGVMVLDFGTSGLDLAYEVMRGYDAMVLVDATRQGGEPGTLYVMEPAREDVEGSIEDGEMLDPHDMNPQTVLRFVNATGGWPGKVLVIGCEPGEIDDVGLGLSPAVEEAVDRAVALVRETIEELRTDAAYSK